MHGAASAPMTHYVGSKKSKQKKDYPEPKKKPKPSGKRGK